MFCYSERQDLLYIRSIILLYCKLVTAFFLCFLVSTLKIYPTNARKVDVKADVKLKTLENAYNKKNCWLFKIKLNVRATAQASLQGRIIFCFPEYDIKKIFFESLYSTYNKLVF